MSKKATVAGVLAVLATAMIGAGAISSAAGARAESSGNRLTGPWMVESANDTSARSPAYGSWERLEGRLYAATSVFFRFNPQTGAFIGSQKINRTIQLAEDGQSFTAVARVLVLDPDGNVIATFSVRSSGHRMEVERIPDLP
jgi:hypothetical protein